MEVLFSFFTVKLTDMIIMTLISDFTIPTIRGGLNAEFVHLCRYVVGRIGRIHGYGARQPCGCEETVIYPPGFG